MSDDVLYEVRDHVARLTLNRPERRNALAQATIRRLIESLDEAAAAPDVWIIVLTGSGSKSFCAGRDLKELDEDAVEGKRFRVPMTGLERNVHEAILETYKPTIASINGAAVAGGFEIALACDMRIAADNAVFGLPEAKRGMGANFGSVVLHRVIPRAIAFELLYTARTMSAEEAAKWGLVNRVVPSSELATATDELVSELLVNAPLSLRRYKEMAIKGWELPVSSALRLNAGPNPYLSEDREEGVRAFVEKRPAHWKGC